MVLSWTWWFVWWFITSYAFLITVHIKIRTSNTLLKSGSSNRHLNLIFITNNAHTYLHVCILTKVKKNITHTMCLLLTPSCAIKLLSSWKLKFNFIIFLVEICLNIYIVRTTNLPEGNMIMYNYVSSYNIFTPIGHIIVSICQNYSGTTSHKSLYTQQINIEISSARVLV